MANARRSLGFELVPMQASHLITPVNNTRCPRCWLLGATGGLDAKGQSAGDPCALFRGHAPVRITFSVQVRYSSTMAENNDCKMGTGTKIALGVLGAGTVLGVLAVVALRDCQEDRDDLQRYAMKQQRRAWDAEDR